MSFRFLGKVKSGKNFKKNFIPPIPPKKMSFSAFVEYIVLFGGIRFLGKVKSGKKMKILGLFRHPPFHFHPLSAKAESAF